MRETVEFKFHYRHKSLNCCLSYAKPPKHVIWVNNPYNIIWLTRSIIEAYRLPFESNLIIYENGRLCGMRELIQQDKTYFIQDTEKTAHEGTWTIAQDNKYRSLL